MAILDQIREHRGAPQFLRMDNGPEFIADTLRDWCKELNIHAKYCDQGSPWQNGRVESFDYCFRDELLTREVFDSMQELRFILEEHRNSCQPHNALSHLTTIEFATKWRTKNGMLASTTGGLANRAGHVNQ